MPLAADAEAPADQHDASPMPATIRALAGPHRIPIDHRTMS
jgi:hypothetical protein